MAKEYESNMAKEYELRFLDKDGDVLHRMLVREDDGLMHRCYADIQAVAVTVVKEGWWTENTWHSPDKVDTVIINELP